MKKVKISDFKLIGIKLNQKTTNERGQSNIDCGNLWQKFEKEKVAEQIPDRLGHEIYAVYFDYEGDHTQPFSYFIGCKVKPDAAVPKGMDSLTIPGQDYVRVIAKGKIPDCISDCWKEIWHSEIERAYNYDFEVYDERSHNWSNGEVDIFLASN